MAGVCAWDVCGGEGLRGAAWGHIRRGSAEKWGGAGCVAVESGGIELGGVRLESG